MNRGPRRNACIHAFQSFVGKHAQSVQFIHTFTFAVFTDIHVQFMSIHGAW